MDEIEQLLSQAGALYDPRRDPAYADITGPTKDFNFAEYYNEASSQALNREARSLGNDNLEMRLEQQKRENKQNEDITAALASTRSPEEVEKVLFDVYKNNGDVESLQQLRSQQESRQNSKRREVKDYMDMGLTQQAFDTWVSTYGNSAGLTPEAFEKSGSIITRKDGVYSIKPDGTAKLILGNKGGSGGNSKRKAVPVYDADGNFIEIPLAPDEMPPPGYTRTKPKKSLDQIAKEERIKYKASLMTEEEFERKYGSGSNNSRPNTPSSSKKRRVAVLPIAQPNPNVSSSPSPRPSPVDPRIVNSSGGYR